MNFPKLNILSRF